MNDVFLGGDIVTGNFSSVGFGAGIGYFDGTDANIGFEEGVILSSGGVNFVTGGFGAGSGVSGDADLELALNEINLTWGVNNVTILEFDFVAESESVAFNYVFASQEYSEFTCTQYNDIFGFFLSGPGIVGPYSNNGVNIALIPDPDNPGDYTNTPIAVNTVNSGFPTGGGDAITCSDIDPDWESYNVYWIDNDYNIPLQDWEGVNQPEEPQLTVESVTGFTTPLVATYNGLVCGETYHIKLAIADAFDSQLNSVVFLEANSFTSPSVVVNPIPNINGPDLFDDPDAINEGCAAAQLEFNSTGNVDYDVILGVEFGGDAELGVDYQATQEDDSELDICFNPDDGSLFPCLTIPAGQETFYINIEAFYDDNPEVVEELEIVLFAVSGVCQQAELAVSEVSFNLYDQIPITPNPVDPVVIACFGDQAILESPITVGGYIGDSGSYTFSWFDLDGNLIGDGASVEVSTSEDGQYELVVQDDCQDQSVSLDYFVEVIEYPIIEMEPLSFEVCYGDIVSMTPAISGGSGDYIYTWPDNSTSPSFEYLFSLAGGPSQDVLFNILDNCTNESFDFSVSITLIDQPDILMDPLSYTACYGDLITITPQISGGSGAYTFDWSDNSNLVTFDYNFELSSGSIQNVDFNVIDDCTNEAFPFSIEVNLEDQPDILMDPLSYTACYGDIIAITPQISGGSGDYSYIWPDSPIACACETFDYNFELSGGATQTIDFEVIDNCTNESFTLSVDITLEDQSNILMEPLSYTACYGDLITITPQISGGSGLYTIFWESFDFEPITGSIIQTTGVSYDYTFELSGGSVQNVNFNVIDDCTNESFLFSVAITLEDQSNILMEPLSYTACYGDVITINPQVSEGSGAYTFVWPDNSNAEVFNFSFDAVSGAIQNVDFNVIDDCTNETFAFTAELNLDSTLSPSVNFIKEDQFCPGDPMVISVIADGSSTYTYEWYDASNTQIGSGLSVTVSPSQDTSYFVKVIDDCNIFTWDFPISVQIPIYNSPSFSLPSFIGCVGDEVEITIENLQAEAINNIDNPQNDLTFFWSASCDNCVSSTEPSIIVTIQEETIEYFVEVTDLCGNTTLTSGLINPAIVEPSLPPPPEFTFDQLTNGVQFQLTANTLNSFDEYDWDFGDGNNSVEPEPFHTYTEEGIYDVELKAYDSLRCENNFKGVVNIFSQLLLYTPDVFSPNGDGVNDSFRVSVVGAESFELLVYDRWGHQLFYTKNPKEGWDGKYPNGILAPQDVYLYKVLYSNKSNDNKVKQGKVAIVK